MTEHLPLETTPQKVKLKTEDYLLLDRSGALDDYAKTELIEGEIVFMNAQHRPHVRAKMAMYDGLREGLRRIGSPYTPLVEASIDAPPESVPEPDLVVTSAPDGDGLVPVGSVALIVEVSDTTLKNDLERKGPLYASLAVPEYWVVDVTGRVVYQLWLPQGEAYGKRQKVKFGHRIEAATIEGLAVETAGIS